MPIDIKSRKLGYERRNLNIFLSTLFESLLIFHFHVLLHNSIVYVSVGNITELVHHFCYKLMHVPTHKLPYHIHLSTLGLHSARLASVLIVAR